MANAALANMKRHDRSQDAALMDALLEDSQPRQGQLDRCKQLIHLLNNQVKRCLPQAEVVPSGSVVVGVVLPNSDVDCTIHIRGVAVKKKRTSEWQRKAAQAVGGLLPHLGFKNTSIRAEQRVPVVAGFHSELGLSVDITPNWGGSLKSRILKGLVQGRPALGMTMRVLKKWAVARHLLGAHEQLFSSYALMLLATQHFQSMGQVPPLWKVLPIPDTAQIPETKPASHVRSMQFGRLPHPDALECVDRKISQWMQRPASECPSLCLVVQGLFLRLASMLLCRTLLLKDAMWTTMSVWHGEWTQCDMQRKLSHQADILACVQRDGPTLEYTFVGHLLLQVVRHWGGSTRRPSVSSVVSRVLEVAETFLPQPLLAKLLERFHEHLQPDSELVEVSSAEMLKETSVFLTEVLRKRWDSQVPKQMLTSMTSMVNWVMNQYRWPLSVEDPLDGMCNTAHSVKMVDKVLTEVMVLVLYGPSALAACLNPGADPSQKEGGADSQGASHEVGERELASTVVRKFEELMHDGEELPEHQDLPVKKARQQ